MGVGNWLNGVILLKYDELITYIYIATQWPLPPPPPGQYDKYGVDKALNMFY